MKLTRLLPSIEIILCCLIGSSLSAQSSIGLYGDSLHAPFYHGIASGDPSDDSVTIWTRITPDPALAADSLNLHWELSADSSFSGILDSGTGSVGPATDHCFHHRIGGLQSGSHYYYRFRDDSGNTSATGRTRAFGDADSSGLKIAAMSCSSLYSGWFNAYRRLSERAEVDLIVHMGDFIYDFVDEDEQVRVPDSMPASPFDIAEARYFHRLYHLDPDLRAMLQRHPVAVLWDNHDVNADSGRTAMRQAFLEWVPVHRSGPDTAAIHRKLSLGPLADLFFMDAWYLKNRDTLKQSGELSMLGQQQFEWLCAELAASNKQWKLVATQKVFSQWGAGGLGGLDGLEGWIDHAAERRLILDSIRINGIDNVVFLTGDAHMSVLADLPIDPYDPLVYDSTTGNGSLAVEILAASISRGNIDERGVPQSLIEAIENASRELNPHQRFTNFSEHGYGLLNMNADSALAEFWYSGILQAANAEYFGGGMHVHSGSGHWSRSGIRTSISQLDRPISTRIYPNPVSSRLQIESSGPISCWQLMDAAGRTLMQGRDKELNTARLSPGIYFLLIKFRQGQEIHRFIRK